LNFTSHVIIFEGEGYDYYLWPVAAIWISDRLLRLARVVYCNLHVRLRLGQTQCTRSTATYDPASNVVRLEVIPGSTMHQPTASSFYYLYQPFRFRSWESHPFTLGSWEYTVEEQISHSGLTRTTTEIGDDEIESSKMPLLNAPNSRPDQDSDPDPKRVLSRPKLIFWIRPYDGWTRSLRDQCLASPNRSVSLTILLEGPYGESFSLSGHESVLLIAGGTGIACAVPYIRENLQRSMMMAKNENDDDDSELLIHNKIHLVWASRETAFVRDVASRELRDALSREEFHASFYITGKQEPTSNGSTSLPPSPGSFSLSSSSSSSTTSLANATNNLHDRDNEEDSESLNLHYGRPDVQELVLQHAQEASYANCSLLIVVSGPTAMADETRSAVYVAMRQGYRGITFREDSFSW
jgi:Ferric reductase NAD binding domain